MNEKNMHGRVFKKLREERGYKLKDVAGDVISTRTLNRFEADETSLPIATFEKLLENCGVSYLDFLVYYYDNTETETTEFIRRIQKQLESGFVTKVINECKKELKKKNIDFVRRLDVLIILLSLTNKDDSKLFEENKRIIKERIESTSKLGWSEIYGLLHLINSASSKDYSCEYIVRIIEECLKNIPARNGLSVYLIVAHCDLLIVSLSFLSRNGYYELVEDRCKQTLNIFNEQSLSVDKVKYYIDVIEILARVYLCQNKKEGIFSIDELWSYLHKFLSFMVLLLGEQTCINSMNAIHVNKEKRSYSRFIFQGDFLLKEQVSLS